MVSNDKVHLDDRYIKDKNNRSQDQRGDESSAMMMSIYVMHSSFINLSNFIVPLKLANVTYFIDVITERLDRHLLNAFQTQSAILITQLVSCFLTIIMI